MVESTGDGSAAYGSEQTCRGIAGALGGQQFHLSSTITLDTCLAALDLENPLMDRGMLRYAHAPVQAERSPKKHRKSVREEEDGGAAEEECNLWEYVARVRLALPAVCSKVAKESFAATALCIILEWMVGGRHTQETILCFPALLHPDWAGHLRPIAEACWRLVDAVCALVVSAGFHKDERALSRGFCNAHPKVDAVPLEHIDDDVPWLHEWVAFFVLREWEYEGIGGVRLPHMPQDIALCPHLVNFAFANLYGIGCPRHPQYEMSVAKGNGLIDVLNNQFALAHHTLNRLRTVQPFAGLTEPARLLSELSLPRLPECAEALQVVRASLIRPLFSPYTGIFHRQSAFWHEAGGVASAEEWKGACDAFHVCLHAPARQWRIVPDWLQSVRPAVLRGAASDAFKDLHVFMQARWVQLGLELGLLLDDEAGRRLRRGSGCAGCPAGRRQAWRAGARGTSTGGAR